MDEEAGETWIGLGHERVDLRSLRAACNGKETVIKPAEWQRTNSRRAAEAQRKRKRKISAAQRLCASLDRLVLPYFQPTTACKRKRDWDQTCQRVHELADSLEYLSGGKLDLAREHANAAPQLATCDGPPDYTYKAAYVESEALLNELS